MEIFDIAHVHVVHSIDYYSPCTIENQFGNGTSLRYQYAATFSKRTCLTYDIHTKNFTRI